MLEDEVVIPVPKTIHVEEATLPKAEAIAHSVASEETPVEIPVSEAAIFENNVSATVLEDEVVIPVPKTIHVEEATLPKAEAIARSVASEETPVEILATEAAIFEITTSATVLEDEIVISAPLSSIIEEVILPKSNAISDSFVATEDSFVVPTSEAAIFEDSIPSGTIVGDAVEYRRTTIIDGDKVVLEISEVIPTEETYEPVVLSDEEDKPEESAEPKKVATKISTIPTSTSGKVKSEEPIIPTIPTNINNGRNSELPETPYVLPVTQQGKDVMATYADLMPKKSESDYDEAMRETYDIPVAPMIDIDSSTSEVVDTGVESEPVVVHTDSTPETSAPSEPETIVADSDVEILYDGDTDEPSEEEPIIEEPVVEEESIEEEPVEEEPVEEEPVEEESIEEEPIEEESVEEEPIEEELIEEEPVEEEPIEEESIEEEPVEDESVIEVVEETTEDEPIEEPVEEVIHTDAIHADELMTDEEAEEHIEIIEEEPGRERNGKMGEINLDTICEHFEDGEIVTLESLQEKKLISSKAGRVKILARGIMTKKLEIVADSFSLQAVKMITLAGGKSEQFK